MKYLALLVILISSAAAGGCGPRDARAAAREPDLGRCGDWPPAYGCLTALNVGRHRMVGWVGTWGLVIQSDGVGVCGVAMH